MDVNQPELIKARRKLLPWWIKFFCWIFMLAALLSFAATVAFFLDFQPELSIFGFDAKDNYPVNALIIFTVFLSNGLAAYCLWFGKNEAIILAKFSAYLGIFLCVASMIIDAYNGRLVLRVELIFLAVFLWKLKKIEPYWFSIDH